MASQFDITQIAKEVVPDGTFLTVQSEPEFAKSIRDASVLIQSNNPATYKRLQRAVIEAYHLVYLRIAAKKLTNFNFLYTSANAIEILKTVSTIENSSLVEEDITDRFSRYSGALQSIVRRIAAAELLKAIPLNSTLKFKDDSNEKRQEAFEDLERILEVIASNEKVEVDKPLEGLGQASVYIAYELNKQDIPEHLFNVPDLNSKELTYNEPVVIKKVVETINRLVIPEGRTGLCRIQMTAQAYNADVDLITERERSGEKVGTSAGVSIKVDKIIEITNEDTIDTIINRISDAINSETLNAAYDSISTFDNYLTNILVAPEYLKPELKSNSTYKKLIYPESLINEKRVAVFDTYYRTNRLNFESRRNSTKVDTELLIIGFYTIDTNYPKSITSSNGIERLKTSAEIIKDPTVKLGIPGLIFGRSSNISDLQSTSPLSLFLNVQKGNVATVSIKSSDTVNNSTTNDKTEDAKIANQIDTFFFYVNPSIDKINQPVFDYPNNELVLRISTSNYINEPPRLITIDLSNIRYPSSNFSEDASLEDRYNALEEVNYIGDEIAALVVDALYTEANISNLDASIQSTNILGAQLGDFDNYYLNINQSKSTATAISTEDNFDSNKDFDFHSGRVQIVAFRYREQEYKAVVDIVKIPPKLWIATGNYQKRRTIWEQGRRRTISIETKDLKTTKSNSSEEQMTDAEILKSVNATVSQSEASKSILLQSVYDKKKLLNSVRSEDSYYRRPQQWLI